MSERNVILSQILIEEQDRLKRVGIVYEEELEKLPKGSIVYKTIKGRKYAYLQYRCGGKIISKYIKNDSELLLINENIKKRKELEVAIKRINAEKKELIRVSKILEK